MELNNSSDGIVERYLLNMKMGIKWSLADGKGVFLYQGWTIVSSRIGIFLSRVSCREFSICLKSVCNFKINKL